MITSDNRPLGMSQVDWLWVTYSPYNVQNEPSEVPSDAIILTEQAINSLISKATGGSIVSLIYGEDPDNPDQMRLMGKSAIGEVITVAYLPKEEHINSFSKRKVTQTDVDSGCTYTVGTDVLAITTNLGNSYLVDIEDLVVSISGGETDTVYTEVINNVVTSNVKIDSNNNANAAVEIKNTTKGLYTKLKFDNDNSDVTFSSNSDGLSATIPIEGGTNIRFRKLTLDEYLVLEPVEDTLYFITDYPYVYLNGLRYGINILPGDVPIVSLTYDKETMTLTYKMGDGSDPQDIVIGAASAENNGLMTTQQYTDFQRLLNALGSITDIASYVEDEVKSAAFSLETGEEEDEQLPLILRNGYGKVLSTVYIKAIGSDTYVTTAEQRAATEEDVEEAAQTGVTVAVGDAILILTLNDGSKVFTGLTELSSSFKSVIEGLNYSDTAQEASFVTSVSESKGIINVSRGKITSEDGSVEISNNSDGGINLKVNTSEETPYTGKEAINVDDHEISLTINSDDKVLSQSEDGLKTKLTVKYDKETHTIELLGIDDAVISSFDASEFIYAGMIQDVELVQEDPNTGETGEFIKIVWNIEDEETKTVYLDVTKLVDVYTAGNGLTVEDNEFSIKIADSDEGFLVVTEAGLKTEGIKDAIDTAVAEEQTRAEAQETALQEAITTETARAEEAEANLQDAIDTEQNRAETKESELESAIADEETRATQAETDLQTAISTEESRAQEKEAELEEAIKAATTEVNTNESTIHISVTPSQGDNGQTIYTIDENDIASATDLSALADRVVIIENAFGWIEED